MADDPSAAFVPDPSWELLSQGAEARIWKVSDILVCKERMAKPYRHPVLDTRLRKSRTKAEAKILQKLRDLGGVPKYERMELRPNYSVLFMEYLPAPPVRTILNSMREEVQTILAEQLGTTLAQLHNTGIVHGDLTTANLLYDGKIYLIDFGLAKHSTSAEEHAVDLYVLERALQSMHPDLPRSFWESVLKVYGDGVQKAGALGRLDKVRQRGRKRDCFG